MSKRFTGALNLLLAVAIYGFYGVLYRNVSQFGFFSQGVVRYSIYLVIILLIILLGKIKWKAISRKDIKWFLIWILPSSIQPVLTFIAFVRLPVGIAYFLTYSTMILGGIVSGKIFFQEKFNLYKLLSLILIVIGLLLIYRSNFYLVANIYVVIAFIAGTLVGFWNTLSKKVSSHYSEFQMMFLDGTSTFIISIIGLVISQETVPALSNTSPWLWMLGLVSAMVCSSFLLIRGFKNIEAQTGSLIMPLEIVFGSIFSYLFLGEMLTIDTYLGGFLIFTAALFPLIKLK